MIEKIISSGGKIEYGIVDKCNKIALIPDNFCVWIRKVKKTKDGWTFDHKSTRGLFANVQVMELQDGAGFLQQLEQSFL